MIKIIVDRYLKGKNVFDIVRYSQPDIANALIYKAFQKKDVKVNGKWVGKNHRPSVNDEILIYIKDSGPDNRYDAYRPDKVYEDQDLLIIHKPSGVNVINISSQIAEKSVIDLLTDVYPGILPCHRLDRNTEGLLLLAKNTEARDEILKLIKNSQIEKYYTAIVSGKMLKQEALLEGYLFKDAKNNRVYISKEYKKGYSKIVTEYKVIRYIGDNSLLRIKLFTGRTHQIRAHLASIGHAVIGDGKYGVNEINRTYKQKTQLLCASELVFNAPAGSGFFYLNKRSIKVTPSFIKLFESSFENLPD